MTLKRGKIRRGLLKKGFIEEHKKKHIRYRFYFQIQRTRINTTVSRGSDGVDISVTLFSKMAQQCYIPVSEFRKLIECSLSEKDYIKLVKEYLPEMCGKS